MRRSVPPLPKSKSLQCARWPPPSEGELIAVFLTDAQPAELLTPRERSVVQLVAEGHSNKQIAQVLSVSVKTVGYTALRSCASLS